MNKLMITGALAAPLAVGAAGFGGYQLAQQEELAENDGLAEVVAVVPVTKDVSVPTSSRECNSVPVHYTEHVQPQSRSSVPTNVIVGGLIGGVLGNQVVNGSKRDAATVLGAATGGYLGYRRAKSKNEPEAVSRTRYEQRCHTVKGSRTETEPDGYDVTYRYQGQIYTTRMQSPPPARFPVELTVSPAMG